MFGAAGMFSFLGILFSRNATKAIKDNEAIRSIHQTECDLTYEEIEKMRDDDDCSDSAPIEGEVG